MLQQRGSRALRPLLSRSGLLVFHQTPSWRQGLEAICHADFTTSPHRSLATQSAASSKKLYANKGNGPGLSDQSNGPSRNSIYPHSKAAERRHPHAPQLFQHFRRRGVGVSLPQSKTPKEQVSSDTYILRNISTDPELKQLYTSLGKAADSHDPVQATKLCQLIKERKEKISSAGTFEPKEKIVFFAVMRALAIHGFLEETQAVHADMLSVGFEDCIESLNLLLQAAVVSGDQDATSAILERIFALQSPSSSTSNSSAVELANLLLKGDESSLSSRSSRGLTLSLQKTRNWNVSTFAHMTHNAFQNYNLEYALLLLSSCYRLGFQLPHESLKHLIGLCLHTEEFRAAVELADLIEQGGLVYSEASRGEASTSGLDAQDLLRSEARSGQVARRLPPSLWMSILRSCAEGGYLPGVELAWFRAVKQGLLSPDDGLVLQILSLAAKEGSVQMARISLRHIDPTYETQDFNSKTESNHEDSAQPLRRPSPASKRIKIQEWHLAPLFEAQCSAKDYSGAMRTLHTYHHRGFSITDRITSRISTSIYRDKTWLQAALDALASTATNSAVGTHTAVVNAVLSAAVWLGDLAQALEIYRTMPSYYTFTDKDGGRPPRQALAIKPNLGTFNTLLNGCIDAADYETGVKLLKDLNKLRIRPDLVTFERMIVLCLTQRNYDNAFGFVEEAKEKGIKPSRKSYEALVRKCFSEKDHRWEGVLADMSDHGYRPSPKLLRALGLDPDWYDDRSASSRSRYRS
ncbi:hypothetical protein NDA18_004159 [Ustilago nuda]|nr:hypothetical protein NDA18_004159 [Ustilago nuda]